MRPFGPQQTVRPAPHPVPFVEQSRRNISLGEQHKPDVNHIHGRTSEDVKTVYILELIASTSPGVEWKLHDGRNSERRDGDGTTSEDTLADCVVCAMEKIDQLARSKNARKADNQDPLQVVHRNSVGHFLQLLTDFTNT